MAKEPTPTPSERGIEKGLSPKPAHSSKPEPPPAPPPKKGT